MFLKYNGLLYRIQMNVLYVHRAQMKLANMVWKHESNDRNLHCEVWGHATVFKKNSLAWFHILIAVDHLTITMVAQN